MQDELSLVVDALPGLVWTALPDGNIDFLSRRWYQYTGLSVDEACGKGWQAAVHPEDLSELLAWWPSILASGEPGEIEVRLRRFDGEHRRFVFRVCPLIGASGRIVKWCGMNTDVEDRRRAEEELRRTEARKTAILDAALDCIVTIDQEGRITEFNPAAERTFGYCRDDLGIAQYLSISRRFRVNKIQIGSGHHLVPSLVTFSPRTVGIMLQRVK